jgi:2-succinyl-6-hydroxy-2,4-cyclohexadiene-1-carboxylate synthase
VPETIVLLHGFGGTSRAWDGVRGLLDPQRYLARALDLPGHGARAAAEPITFAGCVQHVLDRSPERFALCGYSLGGRVALHVALAAPERVCRLLLVSTSAGIDDPAERAARRAFDERLARDLETRPYEEFIERWRAQPLFAGDPAQVGELARSDQRRNDPRALARVLRGLGAGRMQPLWGQLEGLEMHVSVIVGERDEKFLAIGRRMVRELPDGELLVVAGGHALPLENPAALAGALGRAPRRAPTREAP